jgi:diguanylate cyclase (GGDEF)-like protein/PAS domain S-box-containing protein
MSEPLKILIVEDVVTDAELILRALQRANIVCDARRVDTAVAYRRELAEFKPHVILSDFTMPAFNGMEALSTGRESHPDIPFIFVSGTLGEEYAVRALKNGATDYILKTNLLRLPAAVERAIAESAERRARQALEHNIREGEKRYRELFQSNPHPMWVYDIETLHFLAVNDVAIARYEFSRNEFLAMTIEDIRPAIDVDLVLERVAKPLSTGSKLKTRQHRTRRGDLIDVEIASHDLVWEGRQARIVVAYDITDRKRAEDALRQSEARLRSIVDSAFDAVVVMDSRGGITEWNAQAERTFGWSREQIIGRSLSDTIIPARYREAHQKGLRVFLETGREALLNRRIEISAMHRRGHEFPVELTVAPVRLGEAWIFSSFVRDITERVQQQDKIARFSRIQAVLSGINSAIVRIHDRHELFEEACRIASQQAAFHIAWIGLVEGDTLKPVAVAGAGSGFIAKIIEAGSGIELSPGGLARRAVDGQCTVFSNDLTDNPNLDFVRREAISHGCQSAVALPLLVSGKTIGIFMLYCDQKNFFDDEEIGLLEELAGDVSFALTFISQREKADFLAYYDPLTGLPNRALFFDRLTQHLNATRGHSNVALIVLDLDRFRMVNETLGRQGGDALLQALTGRLRDMVQDQDTVARIGADSFALAFPGTWRAEEVAFAMELRNRKLFGQPFVLGGEELRVSAAAGIALAPCDGETAEVLFANAEAALRKAKAQNERFLFYSPEMNVRVADTLRMESQLRRAIEHGELVLWYQPKVNLKTGRLTGFEALMRWQHPEAGMIPPGQFIPLMEQTGLILEAGDWALSQVAQDCASWKKLGMKVPRIAVNVSPLQLRHRKFVSTVIGAAAKAEEAGSALDLEITESVIMENVEEIIPVLRTIRGLGVEIYVDDFGTGYSSLAYIARLPIHSLKIDRSFVVGMTQNQDSLAIVKSVISLAHSLRLNVVAEGLETEEQAVLLRRLKCDQAQGYLISPPTSVMNVPDLLRRLTKVRL